MLDVAGVPHITSKLFSLVSGTTGSTWEVVECRSNSSIARKFVMNRTITRTDQPRLCNSSGMCVACGVCGQL